MLRVDVRQAKPGMKLALPVMNPKALDRVLLKVGYEMSAEIIEKLESLNIRSIWARYPSLDSLTRYLSLEGAQVQNEVVSQIADGFEKMQNQSSAKINYEAYTQSVDKLVNHLISHPSSAVFLGDLADAEDDMLRHSANVTYLSVLIGMKIETYIVKQRKHIDPARAKELVSLGMGAMLHDIGILLLDEEVREKFKKTGDDQDPAWREHPLVGFRHVRGKVEPSAATVVLNHHQRYDGSGYAGKDMPVLKENAIHVFARIGAVADHFDTIRSPSTGLPDQPTVWALSAMLSDPLRSQFDPVVLQTLIEVVPAYAPGTIVRLSDNRWAVVIDHDPQQPCRPTVQCIEGPEALSGEDLPGGEIINLTEVASSLYVAEVDGKEVGELNFGRELIGELIGELNVAA